MSAEDPIHEGFLQTDLEGRGYDILDFGHLSFGPGVPTSKVHISPLTATTSAADGIRWFTDVVMFRNTAGELEVTAAGLRSSGDMFVGSAKVLTEGLLATTSLTIDGGNI